MIKGRGRGERDMKMEKKRIKGKLPKYVVTKQMWQFPAIAVRLYLPIDRMTTSASIGIEPKTIYRI